MKLHTRVLFLFSLSPHLSRPRLVVTPLDGTHLPPRPPHMDFPAPYPQENALLDLLATARADVDRAAAGLAAVQGAGASSSEPATATAATASAVAEAAAWLAAVGQALTKGRACVVEKGVGERWDQRGESANRSFTHAHNKREREGPPPLSSTSRLPAFYLLPSPLPSSLLKEFEQEARLDGMPPPTLAARRRPLAEQLAALAATRAAALSTASTVAAAAAGGVEDGGGATTAKAKAKGKAKAAVDKPTGVDGEERWKRERRTRDGMVGFLLLNFSPPPPPFLSFFPCKSPLRPRAHCGRPHTHR